MPLSQSERDWYKARIRELDSKGEIIVNDSDDIIAYTPAIQSDETSQRNATAEEYVHAVAICMLQLTYKYPIEKMYHEKYYKHGRKGTLSDEVDLVIFDPDELPFAIWEFKSAEEYKTEQESDIELQLFGTAPLVGAPKLLVHATIIPDGTTPTFSLICIEYTKYKTYESWREAGKPHLTSFPAEYQDPEYKPLEKGGSRDLRLDCTQADFRTVAQTLHNELFSEHYVRQCKSAPDDVRKRYHFFFMNHRDGRKVYHLAS